MDERLKACTPKMITARRAMAAGMCHIKKGDKVQIITGREKGKIGKVLRVVVDKERILVENTNMVKRHMKTNAQGRPGGIVDKEAPIHWSNAMLVCDKCIKPIRVKMQVLDDGRKVRSCRKCEEIIDK